MINDYVDDSRKTWRTINEVTSRESNRSAINQLDYKGDTITSCCGIAEAFNDYFCSIALGLLVMIRSASSGCVVWGISSWSLWHWWL